MDYLEEEKEIIRIHQAGETLFPFLNYPHNWLRMKSRQYYNWHLHRFFNHIHFGILGLYSALMLKIVVASLVAGVAMPSTAYAATKSWTSQSDFSSWAHSGTSAEVTAGSVTLESTSGGGSLSLTSSGTTISGAGDSEWNGDYVHVLSIGDAPPDIILQMKDSTHWLICLLASVDTCYLSHGTSDTGSAAAYENVSWSGWAPVNAASPAPSESSFSSKMVTFSYSNYYTVTGAGDTAVNGNFAELPNVSWNSKPIYAKDEHRNIFYRNNAWNLMNEQNDYLGPEYESEGGATPGTTWALSWGYGGTLPEPTGSLHTGGGSGYTSSGTATTSYTPSAGTAYQWTSATPTWNNPSGTTGALEYSSDNSTWESDITSVSNSETLYIKASLSTADTSKTPSLDDLSISYESATDTTAPVVASASIDSAGTTLTVNWTEADSAPVTGSTGLSLAGMTHGAATLSGVTTTGTTTTATISRSIYSDETITLAYSSGNFADSATSPNSVANFSDQAITNNSAQTYPASVVGYTVSGITSEYFPGMEDWNGDYLYEGTANGKSYYKKQDGFYLFWSPAQYDDTSPGENAWAIYTSVIYTGAETPGFVGGSSEGPTTVDGAWTAIEGVVAPGTTNPTVVAMEESGGGTSDTIPPTFSSASVSEDGTTVSVNLTEEDSPPILPATDITGFTVKVNGSSRTITSAAQVGGTQSTTITQTSYVTVSGAGDAEWNGDYVAIYSEMRMPDYGVFMKDTTHYVVQNDMGEVYLTSTWDDFAGAAYSSMDWDTFSTVNGAAPAPTVGWASGSKSVTLSGDSYTVSGADVTAINGVYIVAGTYKEKPVYINADYENHPNISLKWNGTDHYLIYAGDILSDFYVGGSATGPADGAWSVGAEGSSPAPTVTANSNSPEMQLTLDSPVYSADTVTIEYAPGNVTDSADTPNAMAAFGAQSVSNNSTQTNPQTDTTAPTFSSASVSEDGTSISVNLTEEDSPPILPATDITGFTVKVNGASRTISEASVDQGGYVVSGAGSSEWNGDYAANGTVNGAPRFSLDSDHWLIYGYSMFDDNYGWFFVKGPSKDRGDENNSPLSVDEIGYLAIGRDSSDASGSYTVGSPYEFSVDSPAPTVTAQSSGGIVLSLSSPVYSTDTVTIEYAPGNVTDSATPTPNTMASFGAQSVTNNSTQSAPTITLTAPNGNENWSGAGTSASEITWTTSGSGISSIALFYSTNGSTYTSIATGETNDGSRNWIPPSINSATVTIKVEARDSGGNVIASDISDAEFTIDSLAPAFSSATVGADGETVTVNLTESLSQPLILGSGDLGFSLYKMPGYDEVTISSATLEGNTAIKLTLGETVYQSESISLSYNQGYLGVKDQSGNFMGDFVPTSITNNSTQIYVAPDITAPTFNSATVSEDGTTVTVNLTEEDSPPILPATGATGFTVKVNGDPVSVGTITVPSTEWTLDDPITVSGAGDSDFNGTYYKYSENTVFPGYYNYRLSDGHYLYYASSAEVDPAWVIDTQLENAPEFALYSGGTNNPDDPTGTWKVEQGASPAPTITTESASSPYITIPLQTVVYEGDLVTIEYAPGNVTDSATPTPNAMASFGPESVTNSSTQVQPTISLTSPNGAEHWSGGSSHAITWSSSGDGISSAALFYSTNGTTWNTVATGESDDETYNWTVPAIDSSTVKVKAELRNSSGDVLASDASNADFVIDSTGPAFDSATVSENGTTVSVNLTETGSLPILPSTSITGFTVKVNGESQTISSANLASADGYMVTGAGESDYNGAYVEKGTYRGQSYFQKNDDSAHYIFWDDWEWVMGDILSNEESPHYWGGGDAPSDSILGSWNVWNGTGTGPAPVLSALSSTTVEIIVADTIYSTDTATIEYTPGNVTDSADTPNPMTSFGPQSITNNSTVPTPDTTAPVVASASINSAGTTLTINWTEADSAPVVGTTGLSLVGMTHGAATLSSVSTSGTTTTATISRPIYLDEVVTLSYSGGNFADSATSPNSVASFSGQAITNSSTQQSDTTPPTFSSASVSEDGTTVSVNLTEEDSPPILPATDITGFTVKVNGSSRTITSAAQVGGTQSTTITQGSYIIVSGAGDAEWNGDYVAIYSEFIGPDYIVFMKDTTHFLVQNDMGEQYLTSNWDNYLGAAYSAMDWESFGTVNGAAPAPTIEWGSGPKSITVSGDSYTVSGAGTSAANGVYIEAGIYNGKPVYIHTDYASYPNLSLKWNGSQYLLYSGDNSSSYYVGGSATSPADGSWSVGALGSGPAPTVTANSSTPEIQLTLDSPVYSTDTVTIEYAPGNVTDSATPTPNAMASFGAQSVTNDSTQSVPTVALTSPNGAEHWSGSSSHSITWSSSGDGISSVALFYSTNGSSYTSIASGETNDGTYSWTVPSIDFSTVTVKVELRNSNGDILTSDVSNTNFTIDSTDPSFSSISASSNNEKSTDQAAIGDVVTLVFTTSESLSANPTVTLGGKSMTYQSLVGDVYTYTRTLDGSETEGSAGLSISGPDLAGNTGTNVLATFTTDFTVPAAPTITAPVSATMVNAASYTITGTAEANALVTVYQNSSSVGSQQLTGGATSFSIEVTLTQNMENDFTVTATDAVLNQSTAATVPTITEDSTAPSVAVITDPTTPIRINASTYTITGTAEANALVTVYQNSSSVGTQQLTGGATSFSIEVTLTQNAENDFTVTLTDAQDNESDPVQVQTITEDSIAPALPTGITGFGGDGQGDLSWVNPGDSDFDHLNIYRSTTSGTRGSKIGEPASSAATTYTDTTITNGTTYYYTFTSVDTTDNESADSSQVSVQPLELTATLGTPNGGEHWSGGSTHAITWSSSGNGIDSVALLYSTDGGSTFSNAIATGESNDGTYNWTVPSTDSELVRVKVELRDGNGDVLISDSSDANFTIDSTAPTFDEASVSTAGTTVRVDLTEEGSLPILPSTGVTGFIVKVNGVERNITDMSSGTVSGNPTSYLVAGAGTAGVDGTYTQSGTSNGKPSYKKGSYIISADATGGWTLANPAMFQMFYSLPSGETPESGTWQIIGSGAAPAPSFTGEGGTATPYVDLTLATPVYSTDTVTVEYTSGNVTDSADTPNAMASFSAQSVTNNSTQVQPTVSLTSPGGGEHWRGDSSHNITWTSSGDGIDSVALFYSTDGGATYPNTIATGETNDGSYSWTTPSTHAITYRVKVELRNSEGGALASAISATNFAVDSNAPIVDSVSINTAGTTLTINWTEGTSLPVQGTGSGNLVLDSLTYGEATLSNVSTSGTTTTATISRVINTDETPTLQYTYTSQSDDFSDSADPANFVPSFSGQAITNNSTQQFDTTAPIFDAAAVSVDGKTVSVNLTELDSPPILPATGATGFTVKVNGTERVISSTEVSAGGYAISGAGSGIVNGTYLAGDQVNGHDAFYLEGTDILMWWGNTSGTYHWQIGTLEDEIEPESAAYIGGTNPSDPTDGTWATYDALTPAPTVTGSAEGLILTLSSPIYSTETVTLEYTPGNVTDSAAPTPNALAAFGPESVTNNSEVIAPDLSLTSPNGAEHWSGGSTHAITWSATGSEVSSIALFYSTDGGSTFPNTIATGESNDGSYSWTVPSLNSTTVQVKVESRDSGGDMLASQASSANFTIDSTAPTISSASINAAGTTLTVNWTEALSTPVVGTSGLSLADLTHGAATLSGVSTTGTTTTATLSRPVYLDETPTLSYTPGNITDSADTPNPVGAFSGQSISNASTQQFDTTAPLFDSASVSSDGMHVAMVLIESDSTPLLPATEVTGFTVNVNGEERTLASATRTASTTFDLTLGSPIVQGDTVTLSYASGNVTDSATPTPNALANFSGQSVTNGSTYIAPAMNLLSPNGGEIWKGGATYSVTWLASGTDVDSITLLYSTDGGSTFPNTITTEESNDGIYSWTIPVVTSSTVQVKAEARDSGGNVLAADTSEANLSLDATNPTFTNIVTSSNNSVSTLAKVGDSVTTTFDVSEALSTNPTVTFAGQVMTYSGKTDLTYTYTRTLTGEETEGTATISISGTDQAGNIGSGSGIFTTDFTAPDSPVITTPANSLTINADTYVVSGTAEANSLVTVYQGAAAMGTQQLSGGETSFSIEVALTQDSDNTFAVASTDQAGNQSSATEAAMIREDSAIPESPIITSPSEAIRLNAASYVITGTAEAGSLVQVYQGASSVGSQQLETGETEFSISVSLTPDTAHVFTVTSKDIADNESTPVIVPTITEDSTAPSLATNLTTTGGDATVTLTWTNPADTDFDHVTMYRSTASGTEGSQIGQSSNGSYTDTDNLTNGVIYYYTLKSVDTTGNESNGTAQVAAIPQNVGLTLTNPNGGEVWKGGSTQNITWTTTGSGIASLNLYYSTDGGSTYAHTIATSETDDGSYSWTVPTLDSATLKVKLEALNSLGNVINSDVSASVFTIDSTSPSSPTITGPDSSVTINADNYTIIGMAEADSLVTIYQGGDVAGTQQLSGGETGFSISVSLTQNSDNIFSATSTDGAGNESASALVSTITEDSAAPAAPVITNPNSPVTINADTYTITGSVDADSLVTIYRGEDVADTQQLSGGATSFSIEVDLTQDAVNNFTVTSTDGVNNESGETVVSTITEDSTAPEAPTVTAPATTIEVNANSYTITGSAEAGSLVRIYQDGSVVGSQQLAGAATQYEIAVSLDQNSNNIFSVTSTDSASNESESTPVSSITEDSAAPSPPTLTDPTSAVVVNADSYTITGTAEANTLVTIYQGASVVGTQQLTGGATNFAIEVTLSQDGGNTFTVTSTDGVNNESATTIIPLITEDSTAPAAPVITNPSGPITTNAESYTVTGTAEADSLVTIYQGGDVAGTQQLSGGATSFSLSVTLQQNTSNDFTATSTDEAGNESNLALVPTITEDSEAPEVPVITSPSGPVRLNADSYTITGTAEAGSLVTIYQGTDIAGSKQLSSEETSFSISVTLDQDTDNLFTATSTDEVSSESAAAIVPTITEDSTAPALATSISPAGTDATVTLTWTNPADTDFDHINLYRSTTSGTEGAKIGESTTTSYTDSELTNGVTYYYTLKSVDTTGNESNGTAQVAAIPQNVGLTVVGPNGGEVWKGGSTQNITWTTAGSGTAGLNLYYSTDGGSTFSHTIATNEPDDSSYSWTIPTLNAANLKVKIEAIDGLGNIITTAVSSDVFAIDSTAPSKPVVTNPDSSVRVNAVSYVITGTAEANSLVTIYQDGDVAGTQQLSGGATDFSVSVSLDQNSDNIFTVTSTDRAGNESEATSIPTITEDSTAPAGPLVTSPATALTLNADTYTITGTAEANSLVTIYQDGDVAGTQQLSGGATSFAIEVSLTPDTANNFVVTSKDDTGNESSQTVVSTITEDSTAPNNPLVTTPTDEVTLNAGAYTITGTAEAGSLVQIYRGTVVVASKQLGGSDTEYAIEVALDENDENLFTVTATDQAANESEATSVPTITEDSTAPAGPLVTSPTTALTLNADTYTITGTAEANTLVTIYQGASVVGTQQLTGGATSFSIEVSLNSDSNNLFTVTATDQAANESEATSVPTITEDSTAPAAPVVTDPASALTVHAASYTITGTAEANSLVTIYQGASVVGTQQLTGEATGFSINVSLQANQVNSFTVTSKDVAQNESSATEVSAITEDSAAPALPVISDPVSPVWLNADTYLITGTAESGALITVYRDGDVAGTQQLSGGATSFAVEVSLTQDEVNSFTVTSTDSFSQESAAASAPTITEDSTAPAAPSSGQGSGSNGHITLTWTNPVGDALAHTDIYRSTVSEDRGSKIGQSSSASATSYTDDTVINGVSYYYTLVAVDKAGNESLDGVQFSVTAYNVAVTLTAPNGGESWAGGSTHVITWTSSGAGISTVKLLYTRNGLTWTTIASGQPNNGSYSWVLPILTSSTVQVKLEAYGTFGNLIASDTSDSNLILDSEVPTFSNILVSSNNAWPQVAKLGDTVTVRFITSKPLSGSPTVIFGGQPMSLVSLVAPTYTYSRTLTGKETNGQASIVINGSDKVGNSGSAHTSFTTSFSTPDRPIITDPSTPITAYDTSYTIRGTALAGSLVSVYQGGVVVAKQQLEAGQTAYAVVVALQEDSANRFSLAVQDRAGNQSDFTEAIITHQTAVVTTPSPVPTTLAATPSPSFTSSPSPQESPEASPSSTPTPVVLAPEQRTKPPASWTQKVTDFFKEKEVSQAIDQASESQAVKIVTGVIGVTTITLPVIATSAAAAVTANGSMLSFLHYFLFWLFPRRRKKYWGKLVNENGLPIMGGTVGLIPTGLYGTVRNTITDPAGGYTFSLPEKSEYRLAATASGYYSYTGQPESILPSGPASPLVITVHSTEDAEAMAGAVKVPFWYRLMQVVTPVIRVLFWLGYALSVYAVIQRPEAFPILLALIYSGIALHSLREYYKPRIGGVVLAKDGSLLPGAVIRVYQQGEDMQVMGVVIANQKGEYAFRLPANHTYILTAEYPGYESLTNSPIAVKQGSMPATVLVLHPTKYGD